MRMLKPHMMSTSVLEPGKAARGNKAHFQIMTGSTWLPAAMARSQRIPMPVCFACGDSSNPPTLAHLVWHCPGFETIRSELWPHGIPADFQELQLRLAWPVRPEHADRVFGLHAHVREAILQNRYGN